MRTYGELTRAKKVKVFKVRLNNGGYDKDGDYWGIGDPLYCAIAPDTTQYFNEEPNDACNFVRANNRNEAITLFKLQKYQLVRK